jgi:hypothetical protein
MGIYFPNCNYNNDILFNIVAWNVSESIYVPIKKPHDVTTTITKNDLQALVTMIMWMK